MALDLSRPDDCLSSLVNWLSRISIYIKDYHKKLDPEASFQMKETLVKYLHEVRKKKGENVERAPTEEEAELEEAEPAVPFPKEIYDMIHEHFGLPIIVVACKSDSIIPDDGPSIKRARDIQVQVRSICLDIGAALVFTSSAQETNCEKLKKYVFHRLVPEGIPMHLEIEVHTSFLVFLCPCFDLSTFICRTKLR